MKRNLNWPRLDLSSAENLMLELSDTSGPAPSFDLSKMAFTGVGDRVQQRDIEEVRNAIVDLAEKRGFVLRHGFQQNPPASQDELRQFDSDVFQVFHDLTPMTWSEAGSKEIWSWFSLVLLPDVTHWRWRFGSGSKNKGYRGIDWTPERWIGQDLTRHSWARHWWRTVQFKNDPRLAEGLREGEFNQITERSASIGTNPDLIVILTEELKAAFDAYRGGDVPARDLIRDVAARFTREMSYLDDTLFDDSVLRAWSRRLINDSIAAYDPDSGAQELEG